MNRSQRNNRRFNTGNGQPSTPSGMRDASPPPERSGFVCEACGRFIVTAVEGLF